MPGPSKQRRLIGVVIATIVVVLACGVIYLLFHDIPPVDDSDLTEPPRRTVDPAQNPFPTFMQITVDQGGDDKDLFRALQMRKGDEPWDDAFVAGLLERNRDAIRIFEEALALKEWQETLPSLFETELTHLSQLTATAKLIRLQAEWLARKGEYAEARESLLLLWRFAERFQYAEGSLIHQLVGITILAIGQQGLAEMLDQYPVSDSELEMLQGEIASLSYSPEAFAECFRQEYQAVSAILDQFASGKLGLSDFHSTGGGGVRTGFSGSFLFKENETRKLFADTARQNVRKVGMIRAKAPGAVSRELKKMTANRFRMLCHPNAVGRILYTIVVPAYDSVFDRCADVRVVQSLLVTRIAIERFHRREKRLPDTLDELVPAYLEAVPIDLFDGSELRYNPVQRVIYSVGRDLIDGGGKSKRDGIFGDHDEIVLPFKFADEVDRELRAR